MTKKDLNGENTFRSFFMQTFVQKDTQTKAQYPPRELVCNQKIKVE